MSTTANFNLPTEDARYLSLEAMVKVAMERIDAALKVHADAIADHEDRLVVLETAAPE